MHYVYVLRSIRDRMFYTGYTTNLEKRLSEHNEGKVFSTKNRRPLELTYYEACRHKEDALRRERYLKTTYGKRYIKNRIKGDLGV
jgi:putative endonuclease